MLHSRVRSQLRSRYKQLGLTPLMAVVLGLTFAAYLRPDFMLDLANRIVMCL